MKMNNFGNIPHRKKSSHKGNYGQLLVVAGSKNMIGAGLLTCKSALRSGVGKVSYALPESLQNIAASSVMSLITYGVSETSEKTISDKATSKIIKMAKQMQCIAIGPGLSSHESTFKMVQNVLKNLSCIAVIDADGLNALENKLDIVKNTPNKYILTPHPGELSRLCKRSIEDILKKPKEIAIEFAKKYQCILVLKTSNTIVTDGKRVYVNETGNPSMAKAGSGDVLTGVISSFVAQGFDPYQACVWSVFCHGRAGDIACGIYGEYGVMAEDLIEHIPEAICELM